MANQPTKYKKFVATAATATLVASAIVPVASAASFTDVNPETNSHAAAIDALVEQGIIQGYQDGTFKPNATLTRGHVVKMLGKWVEAQGFEVPADWNTVARFSDLAVDNKDQELVKYAAVVKDAGVFNGSNGALNASGSITRENMALTLDRAYAAVFGQSLVEEAAGLVDLTVSDLASAKEEAREAIQALRNLEVSNVNTFMPKDAVTRAQFASFLYRTINVEGGNQTTPPTGEVAIASLKATGATQLTVEFNQAVDTNAAQFDVKRGTSAVSIKNVTFNDAGTSAVIELDGRFTAATYNLTVTGLSEEALKASVTTTQEVATEIKFNSNKLVLNGQKDANKHQLATITFEVYNQYGEIITDTVPTSKYDKIKLRGIKTAEDPQIKEKGILTVWVDKDEDDGEIGTLSFLYKDGDLEIDVEQEVELSDEIEAGEVNIVGVHSKAGYDFTAANVEKVMEGNEKPTDDFVLLFEVTDQFGSKINPEKVFEGTESKFKETSANTANVYVAALETIIDGLRFDTSNKRIFDIDADAVEGENNKNVEILNVDGKYYFAAYLSFDFDRNGKYVSETGENTVTVRAKATGSEASKKITLGDSNRVQSVSLSSPNDVIAGNEDVYVPVQVKDQSGATITSAALLNELTRVNKGTSNDRELEVEIKQERKEIKNFTFVEKNGEVFLKFKTEHVVKPADSKKDVTEDLDITIEVINTGEESEIELKVEENAKADRLSRLASGVSTAVYYSTDINKRSAVLDISDIVVLDQYGRVFDDKEKSKNYVIEVKSATDKFEVSGSTTGDTATLSYENLDDEVKITATDEKVSGSIEFNLKSSATGESLSKLNVTFRAVNESNFASYKLEGTDLVKGDKTGAGELAHTVKVFGITNSGEKVRLPNTAYTILSSEKFVSVTSKDTSAIVVTDEGSRELDKYSGTASYKTSITAVISNGETVSREITVSDAVRKVSKLALEDVDSVAGVNLTSTTLELTDEQLTSLAGTTLVDLLIGENGKANLTFADQYGFDQDDDITFSEFKFNFGNQTVKSGVAVTVSNLSNDDVKVTSNANVQNLTINGLAVNDSFVVTLTADGVSTSVLVHVTKK